MEFPPYLTDVVLSVTFLGGALLLLYRSVGHSSTHGCHRCSGGCWQVKPAGLIQLSSVHGGDSTPQKGGRRWPLTTSCGTHR